MQRSITVLLVDDHDLVRTGLKKILADIPSVKVIGEADCGEDALKLAKELHPDVIIMDVKMPGIGGLEATRKLQRFNPDIKVLIVTVCDDSLFPARMLQAGAAGYLTKGASTEEMVQAIKAVYVGQRYISPDIARQIALKNITDNEKSPFDALSERELQVTLMIINGQKAQDISDKLFLSPKTINSYRYRIFEKLRVKNDVELTLLAIRHGLVHAEENNA